MTDSFGLTMECSPVDRHIVVSDPAFPLVHFNTYFEGGPCFDPPGLEGLTCLTNRLLIRGTRTHSRIAFEDLVEAMGTELVTSTRADAVTLGGTVLARHFDQFIHHIADAICHPRFDEEEFEKARREMKSDLQLMVDEDGHLARHCLGQLIHHGTPLAQPALGSLTSLDNVTLDAVRQCHETTYVQSRFWTSSGGQIDDVGLQETLESAFSALPLGTPLSYEAMATGSITGRRIFFIHKPDRSQTQVMVGQPSIPASHPGFHALQVMTSAFGGQFSSRLMQELRVKRGLSYGAYAWASNHRYGGDYILNASVDSNRLIEALTALLEQLDLLASGHLTDDELIFARNHLLKSHPFGVETAALQSSYRIRAAVSGLGADAQHSYLDYLRTTSPDKIREASTPLISADNVWIVLAGTLTPAMEASLTHLPGVSEIVVRPYDQILAGSLLGPTA